MTGMNWTRLWRHFCLFRMVLLAVAVGLLFTVGMVRQAAAMIAVFCIAAAQYITIAPSGERQLSLLDYALIGAELALLSLAAGMLIDSYIAL